MLKNGRAKAVLRHQGTMSVPHDEAKESGRDLEPGDEVVGERETVDDVDDAAGEVALQVVGDDILGVVQFLDVADLDRVDVIAGLGSRQRWISS